MEDDGSGSSEEEEEPPQKQRDEFCQNPAELRARAEQRRQDRMRGRGGAGNGKGAKAGPPLSSRDVVGKSHYGSSGILSHTPPPSRPGFGPFRDLHRSKKVTRCVCVWGGA